MPDHVHQVIVGVSDTADARRYCVRAKQRSGFEHAQRTRGRLWQRYAFERVVRDVEQLPDLVRYVLTNPLRAGLVERVDDYPFLGSMMLDRSALLRFAGLDCSETRESSG